MCRAALRLNPTLGWSLKSWEKCPPVEKVCVWAMCLPPASAPAFWSRFHTLSWERRRWRPNSPWARARPDRADPGKRWAPLLLHPTPLRAALETLCREHFLQVRCSPGPQGGNPRPLSHSHRGLWEPSIPQSALRQRSWEAGRGSQGLAQTVFAHNGSDRGEGNTWGKRSKKQDRMVQSMWPLESLWWKGFHLLFFSRRNLHKETIQQNSSIWIINL